jgi:CubicO group peptidase (beta-lactamase class C family)
VSETKFDQLCAYATQAIEDHHVPGAVVGILQDGEIASAGCGVTNVDHPLPVTDETLFQIGSITKTFTCLAIMRLVEMEKVDLDATVRTYLPAFKVVDETASAQATVRHLLTHVGGWVGDLFVDTGAGEDALPRYMAEMAELEQLAPFGTVWSYNNAAFSLAGYVIEQVTGQSYEQALAELVLDPLGLEHCYLVPADVMTHRFAAGHHGGDKGAQVAQPWALSRSAYPAGGITCSVGALLRYARFQLGDGTLEAGIRLLQPETIAAMHAPQASIWEQESQMGLSWFIREVDGTRTLGHGGGTNGQISQLTLVPERRFAVAVFTNADGGGSVTNGVTRWALKEYLGLESEGEPEAIESTVDDLAPYVGRYVRPFAEIELGILGRKLVGQLTYKGSFPTRDAPPRPSPPPASVGRCEPDRLLILDGPAKGAKVDVIRKADGSIGWLRMGRLHRRETG